VVKIGDRIIGSDQPPLIIAELGINHGGSIEEAIKIVDSAGRAGASVVKHQTHIAEEEMSFDAKAIKPDNASKSIYDLIEECSLTYKEELFLKEYVESKGMMFISTPFSLAAVDRLVEFDIPAFKIGSGECNNLPLIKKVIDTGKPVILSTGMHSVASIKPTIDLLCEAGNPLAIMHCTNIYPTPYSAVRLKCIEELRKAYPFLDVGLSDHTGEIYAALGAVSLGASLIEVHYTDTKGRVGPDISSSLDEKQFKELKRATNLLFQALHGNKSILDSEMSVANFAFASVTSKKYIASGEELTRENITVKRPATGVPAADIDKLFGRKLEVDVQPNTTIKMDMLKKL